MVKVVVVKHFAQSAIEYAEKGDIENTLMILKSFLTSLESNSKTTTVVKKKDSISKSDKDLNKTKEKKIRKKTPSAYNLFIQSQIHTPEIQAIPSRERFSTVSQRWKHLTIEEKKHFEDLQKGALSSNGNNENEEEKEKEKENVLDIDLDLKNALDEMFD